MKPKSFFKIIRTGEVFSDAALSLTVECETAQPPYSLHRHDFTELVIVTGGNGMHVLSRSVYPITAGDVFVIPEKMRHGYSETRRLSLINVIFLPAHLHLLKAELNKLPGYHALFMLEPKYRKTHDFHSHLRLSSHALAHVIGLTGDLRQELQQRAPGFELMSLALFMQLLGCLARRYTQLSSPDTRALLRISSGIAYLESHYADPIRLQTLCEITHQSPRGLIAYFNSATGMSPIEYLLNLRIRRACELLKQDNLNITEAAYQAGFSDSNYFSRQFRKIMGTSPRQFRTGQV